MTDTTEPGAEALNREWTTPVPAYIPHHTFWPVSLALGITLFVWAPALLYVVPTIVVSVGFGLIVLSLRGWVREIRREWREIDG